jgi:hypothetical protein
MSNPERPSHVWDCKRMLRVRCPDVVDNNTPNSGPWSIGSMRTRLKLPATRLLSLLVAVMPMLALSGCPASNLFYGRLVIINSTGGALRSPAVVNQLGLGNEHRIALPDMADGQAWVRDFRRETQLAILGPLEFSYVDRAGIPQTRTVPFSREVPEPCYDDFFIEIDHHDRLHSGMLVYRKHSYSAFVSHALAVGAGLLLGCWFWRKNRHRPIPLGRAQKPTIDPDMG